MFQSGNLFVNGVPQPHAIDHENLIYPGFIGDWEKGNTASSDFCGCNLMLARLRQNSSSRRDITCYVDLDDRQLKHTLNFVMRYVTGHSLQYLKMHMYKAAVELENLLLVRLLPMRFTVRNQGEGKWHGISELQYVNRAHDSTAHLTQSWLNANTMAGAQKWLTEVIPTFEKSWMTDSRLQATQVYNLMILEEGNALDVCSSLEITTVTST